MRPQDSGFRRPYVTDIRPSRVSSVVMAACRNLTGRKNRVHMDNCNWSIGNRAGFELRWAQSLSLVLISCLRGIGNAPR